MPSRSEALPTIALNDLTSRLLKGGAWALSARLTAAASAFLVSALVTRLLTPDEAGVYYLAASIAVFGAAVAQLGLQQAAAQLIAASLATGSEARARAVVRVSCQLGAAGAGFVALLVLFEGRPLALSLFGSKALASVCRPLALWVAALAVQSLVARIFLGFQNIKLSSWLEGTAANVLCLAAFMALWLTKGHATVGSLLLWSSATATLAALTAAALLGPLIKRLPQASCSASVSEVIHAAWPVFVVTIARHFIEQAYLWIVGILGPAQEVAIFATSWRLVTLVALPLLITNAVIPPFITELHVQRRTTELQSMLRFTATVAGLPAVVVLLAFVAFPGAILAHAYGGFYRRGATILVLLAAGQIINVWSGSCAFTLIMIGRQKLTMILTTLCGVAPLPFAVLAGRGYGIEGIAATCALGIALQNVAMVLAVRAVAGIWTQIDLASLGKLPGLIKPLCNYMTAMLWGHS